jgi:hypothetical protein
MLLKNRKILIKQNFYPNLVQISVKQLKFKKKIRHIDFFHHFEFSRLATNCLQWNSIRRITYPKTQNHAWQHWFYCFTIKIRLYQKM